MYGRKKRRMAQRTKKVVQAKSEENAEIIKALDHIFRPKSIALIGASRRKRSLGREILRNVMESGFTGKVFPVNPSADVVHSMKCYPSVFDVPDEIDMAVICVKKEYVLRVVEDCGRKGVKGIVVITAGFRETGAEGTVLENKLMEVVKKHNMRMIGPNCMGIFNMGPDTCMNATFSPVLPIPGDVAFISQSGGMGVAILIHAFKLNLGFSIFVSVGNKADVSANDLLQYCGEDENTKMILMYLESFGDPRKFTQIAREISPRIPIVAVKSGRTKAGALAASSHTGALAGVDMAVDALFNQCGIIRVDTMDELFDVASAFSTYRFPKGNRVAIITNGGGPGILATDAAEGNGLELSTFEAKTKKILEKALLEDASWKNPIDMLGNAGPEEYRITLTALVEDKNVDGVIALYIPPNKEAEIPVDIALTIAEINKKTDKPILCCFIAKEDTIKAMHAASAGAHLPIYTFPESAANAFSAMVKYKEWRERDRGEIKQFDVNRRKVEKIFKGVLKDSRDYLNAFEVQDVLSAYGIPMAKLSLAKTADEAVKIAKRYGYPVVMKIVSNDIIHKSDVGGVAVDLRSEDELRKAHDKMMKRVKKSFPKARVDGVLIQEMLVGGKETILGMSLDPSFGPLLMFGLGGIYVEVLKDVVFRINPITDREATDMLDSLRGVKLLKGVRGEKPVAIDRITDALMRLSQLIADFREIIELDINPFTVFENPEKCKAVDARIRIRSVDEA